MPKMVHSAPNRTGSMRRLAMPQPSHAPPPLSRRTRLLGPQGETERREACLRSSAEDKTSLGKTLQGSPYR